MCAVFCYQSVRRAHRSVTCIPSDGRILIWFCTVYLTQGLVGYLHSNYSFVCRTKPTWPSCAEPDAWLSDWDAKRDLGQVRAAERKAPEPENNASVLHVITHSEMWSMYTIKKNIHWIYFASHFLSIFHIHFQAILTNKQWQY